MKIIEKIIDFYEDTQQKLFLRKLRRKTNYEIGKDVYIDSKSILNIKKLRIGDFSRINGPIRITGEEDVIIKKYCAFGYFITIISTNHSSKYPNVQYFLQMKSSFKSIVKKSNPISIGNNVWIGDHTIILPGVNIGNGAIVGAGSLVTKDIPAFTIFGGVPGKVIRERFKKEIIQEMQKIKWWNWEQDRIERNKEFFETDLTNISIQKFKSLIKR